MYPIYIHEYKITIWWSAKCGCTTVKELIYNVILKLNIKNVHYKYEKFEPKYLGYKNILIVRNPIDRIISSFINKYDYHKKIYFIKNHNFEQFIDVLNNKTIDFPEKHHTTPQFSEEFNNLIKYCVENKINFIFDEIIKLEEFNQKKFLAENFNIAITNLDIISNKTNKTSHFVNEAYLDCNLNFTNIPSYKSFLNEDIILKIKQIYDIDYKNFKIYNINY